MKAVCLDSATLGEGIDWSCISSQIDTTFYPQTLASQTIERLNNVDVVITNKVVIDSKVFAACPSLKLICVAATGMNNIDLDAAEVHGVKVCNVADYGSSTVAQHALTQLLMCATAAHRYHNDVQQGLWSGQDSFCLQHHPIESVEGKTLVILGYGAIGQKLAKYAAAMGMNIVISEQPGATTIRDGRVSFEAGLALADAYSIHCPLTPKTQHLFNKHTFCKMKPSAWLINTARGAIVDAVALKEALNNGDIAAAALDGLDVEPPPSNHPLLVNTPSNLLITPHSAWASRQARQNIVQMISQHISGFTK